MKTKYGNFTTNQIKEVKKFNLADEGTRVLILIKKISQTSSKYPRSFSQILKSPI